MAKKLIVREPLALKYRPKTLDDLVGQQALVKRIKGMIESQNIPNAILLTGPTGGGKTTTARIISRYINCETLSNCGTCASCVAMDKGSHRDYSEINAADARGIDDVRNLLQQSKFRPTMGNLRIIVIDEAQQLTPQAAQSLLKSLEEPSEHTLWIICSMEPEKLHQAIVNRCQHMRIEAVSKELIVKRFKKILKAEKLDLLEDSVLEMLAEYSAGQMRLAMQNLDSALQTLRGFPDASPEDLTAEIRREFETTDDALMVKIMAGIWKGNTKQAVTAALLAEDAFRMSNRLVDAQVFLISKFLCIESKNIWTTPYLRDLLKQVTAVHGDCAKPSTNKALLANDVLVELNKLRTALGSFTVNARPMLVQHVLDATDIVRGSLK